MSVGLPTDKVANLLLANGYRQLASPLQLSGISFDVAGAFIGKDHSADLVIVGDMATERNENRVVQQVQGIARALDMVRSQRPLTTVIVGPRPVGKILESLTQVGRVLPVEEAVDQEGLRDNLAILLPLVIPEGLSTADHRDLNADDIDLPDDPFINELVQLSNVGESAVRHHFHEKLQTTFTTKEDVSVESEPGLMQEQNDLGSNTSSLRGSD